MKIYTNAAELTDEELSAVRSAAWSEARSAVWSARSAVWSARSAARSEVESAARSAARSEVESAARSAARSEVWSAWSEVWPVVWSEAESAAWSKFMLDCEKELKKILDSETIPTKIKDEKVR